MKLGAIAVALTIACGAPQVRQVPADGPQTCSELLAKANARSEPASLQGTARLDAYVEGQRRSANLLIAIQKPDKLQIQALTPTLDLVALFASNGQRFVSFERGGDRCHQGPTCPHNLARFVPIPLPPAQLVAALVGRPPLLPGAQSLHWDGERQLYRIDIAAGGDTQQLFVLPGSFAFAGTVLLRKGQRVLSLAYDGDRQGVPARMRWQEPPRQLDVTVELRDVEVGAAIEGERFTVPCPAGMAVIELACEASPAALP